MLNVATLSPHTQSGSDQRNHHLDCLDGQLLSSSGGVQQILAVEFYPKISSNLTGSCQLETQILLTFKPVRTLWHNFCETIYKINVISFYQRQGLTYFANQWRLH